MITFHSNDRVANRPPEGNGDRLKKIALFLLSVLAAALLFSGCSVLYDESIGSNIGPYVDPENNLTGDFLPDETSEKIRPPQTEPEISVLGDGEDDIGDDPIADIGDIERIVEPPIEGEYYIGDGFSFYVPFLWRESMVVEIIREVEDELEITKYTFYFVAKDGAEAKVITMHVMPYEHYNRTGGDGGSPLISASRDKPVYILMPPEALPDGFSELDNYLDILSIVSDSSRLEFEDTTTEE